MKKPFAFALILAAFIAAAPAALHALPDSIRQAMRNVPEGAVVGVGSARMASTSLSQITAEARARAEVTRTLDSVVRNMIIDFQRASEADPSQTLAFTEVVTTILAESRLQGAQVAEREIGPNGEFWVVVVLSRQEAVTEITAASSSASVSLNIPGFHEAMSAADRMNRAFAEADSAASLAPSPIAAQTAQPAWVLNPYARFDRQEYLAAVGSGISRAAAERDALGRLAAVFGVGIQVDETIRTSYREVAQSGAAAAWVHHTYLDSEIRAVVGMGNLIGAEPVDSWNDGRGSVFVLAVMNRARAIRIYSELVRANRQAIDSLVSMPAADRNTLAAFSRYQLAAVFADMNISYGTVLSVLGVPVHGLVRGDEFRREAQEIRRGIPIGITVRNDRGGRIHDAFARAFSDLGFRTGGSGHRYVLDVDISVTLDRRYSQHHGAWITWAYKTLRADLRDTATGTVLLPYSIHNLREGHASQAQAEDWVFRRAVEAINREYREMLSEYLSRLVPGR